jgi:multimeric flavodoxin WrbA
MMKFLILNGNPAGGKGNMDPYIARLTKQIKSAGHEVAVMVLRDLKIAPCIGCFNCWVKTPGICSIHDDAEDVSRQYIAADHVILASPLVIGFPSSILKNAMDRNIPIIHPHLEEVAGEVHHKKRYDHYPVISYLLEKEAATDDEDVAIMMNIFRRQAVNVRASLGFVHFTESPIEEIIHAINVH